MKTFKQFQEAAFAIPAAAGVISKVLPAAAATIGAIGTMMQARKRGKYQRKKMEGRVGEQKKIKPKLLDAVRKKQNEIQNPSEKPPTFTGRVDLTKGASTPKRTTFKKPSEKPNLDPKKNTITDYGEFQKTKPVDSKTRKRMNAPENQFNSYNPLGEEAPTNNVGGGQIAGTVEAGDNPPVKKKKKTYAYGGRGSRKMWMNNK